MTHKKKQSLSSTPDSDGPETVQISRTEHEELLRKAEEFSQIQDRLLRSAADFDNAKKRLAKEREEFLKFALEGTIYDLLPTLDHFELALAHLEGSDDEKTKSIQDGFLLIQKQLSSALAERGLKRLETLGKPFDPHQHEAVGHVVSPKEPEGIVVEEALAGYQLNGKLLRAAKVKVSVQSGTLSSEEKSEELT
ncbi:MAG: nucleotide exchange factor GrpE [Candidatus Omnitrophica bacterium]|nr:nucleotide exchange factor GrpE [Candidatus Omnitrophota bacterium]